MRCHFRHTHKKKPVYISWHLKIVRNGIVSFVFFFCGIYGDNVDTFEIGIWVCLHHFRFFHPHTFTWFHRNQLPPFILYYTNGLASIGLCGLSSKSIRKSERKLCMCVSECVCCALNSEKWIQKKARPYSSLLFITAHSIETTFSLLWSNIIMRLMKPFFVRHHNVISFLPRSFVFLLIKSKAMRLNPRNNGHVNHNRPIPKYAQAHIAQYIHYLKIYLRINIKSNTNILMLTNSKWKRVKESNITEMVKVLLLFICPVLSENGDRDSLLLRHLHTHTNAFVFDILK